MESRHTGSNLNEFLKNELAEWNLNRDNLRKIFVTDNAPNMLCCISLSDDWEIIPCFDHTLQLAIKDVEKGDYDLNSVITKAKKIVSHFKHSTQASKKLKDIQQTMFPDLRPLVVVQHVETRWNSKYDMLYRLANLRLPIDTALAERGTPGNFKNDEWEIVD